LTLWADEPGAAQHSPTPRKTRRKKPPIKSQATPDRGNINISISISISISININISITSKYIPTYFTAAGGQKYPILRQSKW